jgi:hypothetical protein
LGAPPRHQDLPAEGKAEVAPELALFDPDWWASWTEAIRPRRQPGDHPQHDDLVCGVDYATDCPACKAARDAAEAERFPGVMRTPEEVQANAAADLADEHLFGVLQALAANPEAQQALRRILAPEKGRHL